MEKKLIPISDPNYAGTKKLNPYDYATYRRRSAHAIYKTHRNITKTRNTHKKDPHNSLKQIKFKRKRDESQLALIEQELMKSYGVKLGKIPEDEKQKCKEEELKRFMEKVHLQATPSQLGKNAEARDFISMMKRKPNAHDAATKKVEAPTVVKVNSPDIGGGEIKLKEASPTVSLDAVYVPSQKVLSLKSPRSGLFVNETEVTRDSSIPFETYNPRLLQEQLNQRNYPFDICEDENNRMFAKISDDPELNFDRATCCCELFRTPRISSDTILEECIHFKPKIFPIPEEKELELTFKPDIIRGSKSMPLEEYSENTRQSRPVTAIFSAFATSFTTNPKLWSSEEINNIIEDGHKLWQKSYDIDYKDLDSDFDILPEIDDKLTTIRIAPIVEHKLTEDPNLLKVLSVIVPRYSHILFRRKDLFLLIFKKTETDFYIFDPNGRDIEGKRDSVGSATLITVSTIESIVHLILNKSGINPDDCDIEYKIYGLFLVNFGLIPNPYEIKIKKRKKRFIVVNKYYAIIPGTMGIQPPYEPDEENASIMISYSVLMYSHIDSAKHWTPKVINALINLGIYQYSNILKYRQVDSLNIKDMPTVLTLGVYRAIIEKIPFYQSGFIEDSGSFRNSPLRQALLKYFKKNYYAILQIDNSSLAIWRDETFFYVFDAFERGSAGRVLSEEVYYNKGGVGCLHLHLNFDSMVRIIYKNALLMINEGNFFLHGFRTKSINLLSCNKYLRANSNDYDVLHMFYPIDCDDMKRSAGGDDEITDKKKDDSAYPPITVPLECLSVLSLRPCQRACSETEFIRNEKLEQYRKQKTEELERSFSLHSLPDSEKIPEYDTDDITNYVLNEIICGVDARIKKREEKLIRHVRAKKVLVKTDKGHLEAMLLKVKRGEDYDNYYEDHKSLPECNITTTLEEELNIPTNFKELIDGTFIIFGNKEISPSTETGLDLSNGIVAAFAAIIMSKKYKISTWSNEMIDYTLDVGLKIQEKYKHPSDIIPALFDDKIPDIQIEEQTFHPEIKKIDIHEMRQMVEKIRNAFVESDKLLILLPTFSCALLKRYNFFYLFIGFPTDSLGFHSSAQGLPCLIRFSNLDFLLQRINFDQNNKDLQKFVILSIDVTELYSEGVSPKRFLPRTISEEEQFLLKEIEEKKKQEKKIKEKLAFIKDETKKERQRIREFKKEKHEWKKQQGSKGAKSDTSQEAEVDASSDFQDEDQEEGEEENLESEDIKWKHDPNQDFEATDPIYQIEKQQPIGGYQLSDKDCLYKIQGTDALEDRSTASTTEIKLCYFASIYAVLHATVLPLSKWDYRRIDMIIENARQLSQRVTDKSTECSRNIHHLEVDNYNFNVVVKSIAQNSLRNPSNIDGAICAMIKTKKFFLLQLSNVTYAVYYDQFFHLFDPYRTLETTKKEDDDKSKNKNKSKNIICPKKVDKVEDKNTSSWIVFPNKQSMFNYIDDRAVSSAWTSLFKLHIIDIISFRKLGRTNKAAEYLHNNADDEHTKKTDISQIEPEEVCWLQPDAEYPPWSRTTKLNLANQNRNCPMSKNRAFDIELPNEMWSLWGNIHPNAPIFKKSRGKQYLAIEVLACCIAHVYRVKEWNPHILDSIVVNGDKYFKQSTSDIKKENFEIALENLNTHFTLNHFDFQISIKNFVYGQLYNTRKYEFNLSKAMLHFFNSERYGVLQCRNRSLAFGLANNEYFMFDCQPFGQPLFDEDQGASYVLRCATLKILMQCIVLTLNIPYYNVNFTIHTVLVKAVLKQRTANDVDKDQSGEEEEEFHSFL